MMKRFSLTFLFFLTTTSLFASAAGFPADSIRVKWMDGKKYILHKVELKETWTSISKLYNCTVGQLQDANTGVTDLKTGQIIHVPVVSQPQPGETGAKSPARQESIPSVAPSGNPDNQPANPSRNEQEIYYTVKKGETLYSIAKKHQLTVAGIKELNKLTQDVVNEGQQLVVGVKPAPASQPSPVNPVPSAPAPSKSNPELSRKAGNPDASDSPTASASISSPAPVQPVKNAAATGAASGLEKPTKSISPVKKSGGGKTLMQVTETGVASWIQDGQLNQNKYYALHRTAPIGTIIKVTNRMNNQFVYVKVVGLLPDTGENDNVILKVSQAVKGKLNALDPLFQVELNYGLLQ